VVSWIDALAARSSAAVAESSAVVLVSWFAALVSSAVVLVRVLSVVTNLACSARVKARSW